MYQYVELNEILHHTFVQIEAFDDEIHFFRNDGKVIVMCHEQDCCEVVSVEEIIGDLRDLLDTPIRLAEERTQIGEEGYGTWTFYEFATVKGWVTIRWYGESNGYYSESVSLEMR